MPRRIVLFVSAMLLILSGVASASNSPVWKQVRKSDTPQMYAKRHGITVAELLALNPDLARRPKRLISGELLNINLASDSTSRMMYRWIFPGGDPAGPSLVKDYTAGKDSLVLIRIRKQLAKQIPLIPNVSDDVKERFRSQLEWSTPVIRFVRSTPDTPLVLHALVFGGYRADSLKGRLVKSKVKVWAGPIVCLWTDLRTKKPEPDQLVAMWDPINVDGELTSYQLVMFLGCQNAAVIRRELPPEPVVMMAHPETTIVVPPPPPPPMPPPPPPPVSPPPVEKELRSRDYVTDYVAWLTDEYVRIDPNGQPLDERTMNNIFIGHEFGLWTSPSKRLGLRVRNAESLFDMKARAGDHNAGLVVVPFSNRYLRLDIEGGIGYSAIKRLYTVVDHPDQYTWTWEERKRTTDGFGTYIRTQWILPTSWYTDLKYRDHGVISNIGGYTTWRPGWFYAKLAYDRQLRPHTVRHVDGGTIPFAADSMTMNEARLGISFSPRFLAYGSYQHWEYSSGPDLNRSQYWFTRFGPGGGLEWYPFRSLTWRFDANVIRFKNIGHARFPYGPGWADVHTRNSEWRLKVGVVYMPQPK